MTVTHRRLSPSFSSNWPMVPGSLPSLEFDTLLGKTYSHGIREEQEHAQRVFVASRDAVKSAAGYTVAIHARRRIPSSGIIWRDGIIVSASHTVRRDGVVRVALPDGDR